MMQKSKRVSLFWLAIAIAMIAANSVTAQSSYKGLTPGKSTRAEVARILGQPIKTYSDTLVDYGPQSQTSKVRVQFRVDSTIIERIEVFCWTETSTCDEFAKTARVNLAADHTETMQGDKFRVFYPSPAFVVASGEMADVTKEKIQASRLGFYSRELFEAELKKARDAGEEASIQANAPASSSASDSASSNSSESTNTAQPQPLTSSSTDSSGDRTVGRDHEAPIQPAQPAPQYDNLIQKARASWTAQDTASAIRFAQQAIAENPSRPEGFQNLGFYQLYGSRDFNGALETLRASLARGGMAEFRVSHDHSGNFSNYCQGSLWVSKTGVAYVGGSETFNVTYADVKEAKANTFMGAGFGSFHIKITQNGKTNNYNFAPATLQLAESNVALSLILYH